MHLLMTLDCVTPPLTGIGQYTCQLAKRLAGHRDIEAFLGLHGKRCLDGPQTRAWLEELDSPSTSFQGSQRWRTALRQVPGSYALRHHARRIRFAWHTRNLKAHVYWEPGLELQGFSGRRVATIYDFSHLVAPEWHPPARVAYLERQIERSLREADHLVTISQTMRHEISVHAGISEASISVAPPAASPAFRPLTSQQQQKIRNHLRLPEQYILTVGTLEPRKNLARLLQAYESLPATLRCQWPLVCVGGKGWHDGELAASLARLERRGDLLHLGYVSQEKIPLITACAGLMAYPSLYEGFGMPVVEAMACGVPVLTSRHTAMHEITGESAFLVNPRDVDDLRHCLAKALEDTATRIDLARHAPHVAARYDWDSSAELLLKALHGD